MHNPRNKARQDIPYISVMPHDRVLCRAGQADGRTVFDILLVQFLVNQTPLLWGFDFL